MFCEECVRFFLVCAIFGRCLQSVMKTIFTKLNFLLFEKYNFAESIYILSDVARMYIYTTEESIYIEITPIGERMSSGKKE